MKVLPLKSNKSVPSNSKGRGTHDELRAACCDQRIDLLVIAEHLHNILHRCCERKHIASVDHIFKSLPPYDQDAGLVW